MNYFQSSRWIQLGLAVLASNLPTAVNAARLDGYADGVTADDMSLGITSPDPVEDTTDDSTTDIPPVEITIKPEQPVVPAFTNLQPVNNSYEQSASLAKENKVDSPYETLESISEETTLTEERVLEPVTIAVGMSQEFTVPNSTQGVTVEPTTSDIFPVEGVEQSTPPILKDLQPDGSETPLAEENEVSNLEVENFSEISESISEEIELSKDPSSELVENLNALPSEAIPVTRVISPDEVPVDISGHGAASNRPLAKMLMC